MKLFQEFKAFAMKGNVVDMAVGIIIGAAFGRIITSFVGDILMPPVGMLIGGVNFTDLKVILREAIGESPAVSINYGAFIQVIIDFLIIAFAIFMVVKALNMARRKEIPSTPTASPTKEEALLTEIRDILKSK